MKIKKGDTVKVLSGNDKGKTGEVLEIIPKTNKIVVKGVNIRKKKTTKVIHYFTYIDSIIICKIFNFKI